MTNSLKSILPCPHCGKSDFDEWPIMEAIGDDRRYIRCVWCLASAPEATWNTRAPIAEGGGDYAEAIDEIETLFNKCASTLLPADYANGYLESIRHIKDRAAEKAQLSTPAAIESLSRQGGDMSKNPENLDTSAERVYGIDISQVEYDRELIAKMLDESADVADCEIGFYSADTLREQAALLRAADNHDAAGVHTGRASEAGDWVLVPRVPTKEMCRAGLAERHDDLAKSIYAAMIAAAPAPGGG